MPTETLNAPVLFLLTLLLAYALLIRHVRHRRAKSMAAKYGFTDRQSYATMTATTAQSILAQLATLEFPRFYGFSIFFAIFKTYGLPSTAALLTRTGQLTSDAMSKRLADTQILVMEMCLNPPESQRCRQAIARMNYLHSRYRQSGKIAEEDMLYTLSLFALEPVRWAHHYEWRELTELELCAQGTLWKAIGDAMDISFGPLPGVDEGWKDGVQFLNDIQSWSEKYEEANMVPGEDQKLLADKLMRHAVPNCPEAGVSWLKQVFAIMLGERVASAMGLPRPGWLLWNCFESVFWVRKMALRYLTPPRPEGWRKKWISKEVDSKTGRIHSKEWLTEPWYVKPTPSSRWGLEPLIKRAMGSKMPGDDEGKYAPEGYIISEMGPEFEKERGQEFMRGEQKRMEELSFGTSPFHFTEGLLEEVLEKELSMEWSK